ncbi:putative WRKY transcription factor 17 [Capsicum baccatum]|uniref:Putative WRKY transcription factor 17 n=1 Tax=Capsicum baccatum TaxID=33114 RepID=A0A2G2V083_CAPBA|nr:putative WRKY transcription factor 17 [Capsicum baccatum]
MNKELAFQEVASIGLKTMDHLIKFAANKSVVQVDCREITDLSVAKLKKANAVVGRTGHARFRCVPIQVQAQNKDESKAQD